LAKKKLSFIQIIKFLYECQSKNTSQISINLFLFDSRHIKNYYRIVFIFHTVKPTFQFVVWRTPVQPYHAVLEQLRWLVMLTYYSLKGKQNGQVPVDQVKESYCGDISKIIWRCDFMRKRPIVYYNHPGLQSFITLLSFIGPHE